MRKDLVKAMREDFKEVDKISLKNTENNSSKITRLSEHDEMIFAKMCAEIEYIKESGTLSKKNRDMTEIRKWLIEKKPELLISKTILEATNHDHFSSRITLFINAMITKRFKPWEICVLMNRSYQWFYKRRKTSRPDTQKEIQRLEKVTAEKEVMKKIRTLDGEGKGIIEIANILNLSPSTVYNRLKPERLPKYLR